MVAANHPLVEQLECSPDDGHRRDLVRGRLIDMPPAWHESSRVAFEIAFHLRRFIGEHHLPMTVAGADAGIRIAEPRAPGLPPEVVSPDTALDGAEVLPGFSVTLREIFERP